MKTDTPVTTPEGDWTVTQDRPDAPGPARGLTPWRFTVAVVRRFWRWLTSMRTALILLFLLAVAAIPGSLLPQQKTNPEDVATYYQHHPKLAPIVNDLGGFAVFGSPWFSAIYLLLFISLVGCVVPRLRVYYVALRRVPPDAPSRLSRMPVTRAGLEFDEAPAVAAERIRGVLKSRRYRTAVRSHDDGSVTVSAEKGYLKEAGNLLFHFSLLALLVGVAFGSWYGWHADRLLVEGTSFCSTPAEFADYSPGARITPAKLSPFCVSLNSFDVAYTSSGEAKYFRANGAYTVGDSTTAKPVTIQVNKPLRLPHANVYLVGHGYAVTLKFTDKYGKSETTTVPFLTQDTNDTSTGVATYPDLNINPATGTNTDPKSFAKQQIGFEGTYVPTVSGDLPTSIFPGERNPELFLTPYVGNLGLDNGTAQNVYALNQASIDSGALKKMGAANGRPLGLKPGASTKLPDGSTVQFVGTKRWASLAIRYDPGEKVVLVGALLLVIGLVGSLTGRRRRVWFRLKPTSSGASGPAGSDGSTGSGSAGSGGSTGSGSTGEAGGLARAEYASFPGEFSAIVTAANPAISADSTADSTANSDSDSAGPNERAAHGNALP